MGIVQKYILILCVAIMAFFFWRQHTHAPTTCTIMQFNIENGGTQVSLDHILRIIHAAHPDVIAIEEADGNIPLIAQKLGWPYYNVQHQIISRFPIKEPSEGKDLYLFIEITPSKYIALSNVHLPDEPYGPYLINKGATLDTVYANERKTRLSYIEKHLKALSALARQSIPTFFVGDFNAPSHLDWISSTVGKHEHISKAVEWPVSKAVEAAGFRDSYREKHPNPLSMPGFTWWAHRPKVKGWNPSHDDPHDRIDFIYVAGPAKTIQSQRIGSCCTLCAEISIKDWPSDHCAIVSTFELTPAKIT